jgi:hypothetical protein
MELNPQRTLDQLEDGYIAYLNALAERRPELAISLRRAISRGEIEVGNLAKDDAMDVDTRLLCKRLMCTVELAKGSLPNK